MYKRFLSLAVFLALAPLYCYAQELWTLEKCINYAWENNLQIKQQNIAVQQNKNTLTQSKIDLAPSFSGSLSQNMSWGKSIDLQTLKVIDHKLSSSTSGSVNASATLFDGLAKFNTIKSNQSSLEISLQEVSKLKNNISISITKAFLQVLLAKQILTTTQENFKSIAEQRERTKKLVDAGNQAYTALLDIEAQLATERVQVVTAENNVVTNTLTLMQLLDLQFSRDFEISSPDIEYAIESFVKADIDSLYETSTALPRIKSAELSLQKSKYDLRVAKGSYYPRLSLSAGYGTFFSSNTSDPFFTQLGNNFNPSLGFGLSIPIFSNWRVNTNVRNAKLAVESKEIELRSQHQNLYKEIQTAVNDANSYYQKLLASDINLKAMQ